MHFVKNITDCTSQQGHDGLSTVNILRFKIILSHLSKLTSASDGACLTNLLSRFSYMERLVLYTMFLKSCQMFSVPVSTSLGLLTVSTCWEKDFIGSWPVYLNFKCPWIEKYTWSFSSLSNDQNTDTFMKSKYQISYRDNWTASSM